jgi:hypothetical protein
MSVAPQDKLDVLTVNNQRQSDFAVDTLCFLSSVAGY